MCKYLHNLKKRITFVSVIKTTKNRRQRISGIKTMTTTVVSQLSRETRDQLTHVLNTALKEVQGEGTLVDLFRKDYQGLNWLWNLWAMANEQYLADMREDMKNH